MPKFEVTYEGPDNEIMLQTVKADSAIKAQVHVEKEINATALGKDTIMLKCGFITIIEVKEIRSCKAKAKTV